MLKKWAYTKETREKVLQEIKATEAQIVEEANHFDGNYFVTEINLKALWQSADTIAKKLAVLAKMWGLA